MTGWDWAAWTLLVAVAYLVGSVSFGVLIVRSLTGGDVRRTGSGNAGATNVWRAVGARPAVVVLGLDVAKGAAVVGLARLLGAPRPALAATAVAVVLGHVFPLFFGLRGGKGVATATGAFLMMEPLAALGAIALFAAVAGSSRFVSLASIAGAAAFPLLAAVVRRLFDDPPDRWLLAAAVAVAGLVVFKHSANLGRLLAGTEPRLGRRPRRAADSLES